MKAYYWLQGIALVAGVAWVIACGVAYLVAIL